MYVYYMISRFAPLPLTLCGEFFSSEAKDVSSFISIFVQILFVFLTAKYQVQHWNFSYTVAYVYAILAWH